MTTQLPTPEDRRRRHEQPRILARQKPRRYLPIIEPGSCLTCKYWNGDVKAVLALPCSYEKGTCDHLKMSVHTVAVNLNLCVFYRHDDERAAKFLKAMEEVIEKRT